MATHLISGSEPRKVDVPSSAVLSSPTSTRSHEVFRDTKSGKMAVEKSPNGRVAQSSPSDNSVMKHLRENPYVLGLAAVRYSPCDLYLVCVL